MCPALRFTPEKVMNDGERYHQFYYIYLFIYLFIIFIIIIITVKLYASKDTSQPPKLLIIILQRFEHR